MKLMPVGMRVTGKPALVVGAGAVALRKIRLLVRYGANVMVIAPEAVGAVRRMAADGKIVWRRRRWSGRPTRHRPVMVFACSDNGDVNLAVAKWADAAGVWVNRADDPRGSSVHIPAVTRIGPVTVALFSGGRAPGYVKHLRERIERVIGTRAADELRVMAGLRKKLKAAVPDAAERGRRIARGLSGGAIQAMARMRADRRVKAIRRFLRGSGER